MSRHCIAIIDMLQETSRREALRSLAAEHIVPNLKKLMAFARDSNSYVAFIQQTYQADHFKGRPGVAEKDAERSDSVLGLRPDQAQGDFLVVQKNRRLSAFAYTDFDRYLREKDRDTVVVTGVETNAGVRITASDALYHAYKVICISDCCASSTEFTHNAGLRDLETFSEVITLREYMYKYSRVKV